MIKQMLEYVDIDGQRVTRTVMFNLTQFEVEGEMELEVLQDRFQKFQDEVVGNDPNEPIREMTGPEKREMLGLVKSIIRHSYGVKDGKQFKKSQDLWDEFEQTGAFSAFIYYLFEKPERANAFMMGIWPQGLDRPDDPDNPQTSPDLQVVTDDAFKKPKELITDSSGSAWDVKDSLWEYKEDELLSMSDGEFEAVTRKFSQGRNVPLPLLQVGARRKTREGGTE